MPDNPVSQLYNTTPMITRILTISSLLTTILVYSSIIQPYQLTYSVRNLVRLQLHRLFTTFLHFGPPSFDTLLHLLFLARYSKMLEESYLSTSDYFYLILVACSILLVISTFLGIPSLGPAFSATITYIWTRKHPHAQVQLLGCVIFPAFYLPFIVPLFNLITEFKMPFDDVAGIFVGHFYWFFKYIYPKYSTDVLGTPRILKCIFGENNDTFEDESEPIQPMPEPVVESIELVEKDNETVLSSSGSEESTDKRVLCDGVSEVELPALSDTHNMVNSSAIIASARESLDKVVTDEFKNTEPEDKILKEDNSGVDEIKANPKCPIVYEGNEESVKLRFNDDELSESVSDSGCKQIAQNHKITTCDTEVVPANLSDSDDKTLSVWSAADSDD